MTSAENLEAHVLMSFPLKKGWEKICTKFSEVHVVLNEHILSLSSVQDTDTKLSCTDGFCIRLYLVYYLLEHTPIAFVQKWACPHWVGFPDNYTLWSLIMGIAHPVYKVLYRIHNRGPNISQGTIHCIMQVFKHRWHHPSMFPDKLISRITHDR